MNNVSKYKHISLRKRERRLEADSFEFSTVGLFAGVSESGVLAVDSYMSFPV